MQQPRFSIEDKVFHILPDSPEGFVIDVVYRYSTNQFEYLVVFDVMAAALTYYEYELSKEKRF